ncbi:MAG: hypothetical protein M3R65_02370 [Gemmatimonadota bacterium]|nr:hypothetical protein [Gemmatimonadota bacterium]
MTAFPAASGSSSQAGSATRASQPAAPPYSLDPVLFPIRALAECAAAAAVGNDRAMALATFLVARLMLASLPPILLHQPERALRADHAKTWLSALTVPQPARMALLRSIDATIVGGLEAAASLRELINTLTGHLAPAALSELGALAERLRLYYEQTP